MWHGRRGGSSVSGRSRGGSTASSRRRPLEWEAATLAEAISLPIGICDSTTILTFAELDAEYSDSTLERLRGVIRIFNPGASYAWGAAGIILVDGGVAGAASVWCPLTDPQASWIWHTYWVVGPTNVLGFAHGAPMMFEDRIDSRARRKLEAGDSSLALMVENDVGSNSNVDYWWGVRMLLAEK